MKWATKYTEKEMRKELKHFTIKKNQLNTKEDSNAEIEGKKGKVDVKQITITKVSLSLLVISLNMSQLDSPIKR